MNRGFGALADSLGALNSSVKGDSLATERVRTDMNQGMGGIKNSLDSMVSYNISFMHDTLQIIMDTTARKVVDAIDSLRMDFKDSVRIQPRDTILDSINAALHAAYPKTYGLDVDSIDLPRAFQLGYDTAARGEPDSTVPQLDSSWLQMMGNALWADGSVFDSASNFDSLETSISQRLDSARTVYNARSDSMVRRYADTTMKYYGVDSMGGAVRRLFSGYSSDCPRNCLVLNVPGISPSAPTTRIDIAHWMCDEQFIAGYTPLQFLKMLLRLLTAYLCVFKLMRAGVDTRRKK